MCVRACACTRIFIRTCANEHGASQNEEVCPPHMTYYMSLCVSNPAEYACDGELPPDHNALEREAVLCHNQRVAQFSIAGREDSEHLHLVRAELGQPHFALA